MDKKAAVALEASIKHWEENVAAETPDESSTSPFSCALCKEYNLVDIPDDLRCSGCPVFASTKVMYCDDTPFVLANKMLDRWLDEETDGNRDAWREAAQAELDFLKSLREPKKGDKKETD